MKFKVMAFIVLVIAFSVLIAVKGVRTDQNDAATPETNTTIQTSANLIDQAIQNKQPAWLLFHSTT